MESRSTLASTSHNSVQRTGLLIGTTSDHELGSQSQCSPLRGYTSDCLTLNACLCHWYVARRRPAQWIPLMLRFPSTIRVWNRRAEYGVLRAADFLPAIQTLRKTRHAACASNVYWRQHADPAIQHVAAQDWADLWAIPLYRQATDEILIAVFLICIAANLRQRWTLRSPIAPPAVRSPRSAHHQR